MKGFWLFFALSQMMIQLDGNHYLTATQAAKRLEVSDETIRRWARLGRLPARKVGLQYFILEQDVEELAKVKPKSH
jgi:excisionase family DNA binding protein